MARFLMNWCPEGLYKALSSQGMHIDKVKSSSLRKLISLSKRNEYDAVYFARFSPPLVDKEILSLKPCFQNIFYAFHSPLRIDFPIRPRHITYNLLMPLQAKISHEKGFSLHLLNKDDYTISYKIGARNSWFVPLGVDMDKIQLSDKEDRFTVIYSSRASWHKGTDLLVNYIIPLLLKKVPDINIIVVKYGFLKNMYKKLDKDQRIIVADYYQKYSDFLKVLSRSHALLFPSRYESYGRLLMESLASGVIPITFSVRGVARDVLQRDNILKKFVILKPNVYLFTKKVIDLYHIWRKESESYERLVSRARMLGLKYSWNSISHLFVKMLLNSRPFQL